MRNFLSSLFLLPIFLSGDVYAVDIQVFNPLPETAYEATTPAQDELIAVARSLAGDSVEEAQLSACRTLMEDETAPASIRRWATLRQITLLTYIDRVMQAIEIGRDWLRTHPDDPAALEIRIVLTQLVSQRKYAGGRFPLALYEELFADVFNRYESEHPALYQVYFDYGSNLFKYTKELGWRKTNEKALSALERVKELMETQWEKDVLEGNDRQSEMLHDRLVDVEFSIRSTQARMKGRLYSKEEFAEEKAERESELESRKAQLLGR